MRQWTSVSQALWIVWTVLSVNAKHYVQYFWLWGWYTPPRSGQAMGLLFFAHNHFYIVPTRFVCNHILCILPKVCANLQSKFLHHRLICRCEHFVVNATAAEYVAIICTCFLSVLHYSISTHCCYWSSHFNFYSYRTITLFFSPSVWVCKLCSLFNRTKPKSTCLCLFAKKLLVFFLSNFARFKFQQPQPTGELFGDGGSITIRLPLFETWLSLPNNKTSDCYQQDSESESESESGLFGGIFNKTHFQVISSPAHLLRLHCGRFVWNRLCLPKMKWISPWCYDFYI